ncbi:hypothetical protein ACFQX4_19330 [Roseomonas sp. GCM10028921]
MTAPSRIELEIGEVVLVGFAPRDRLAIAATLEAELARLLADGGLPAGWTAQRDATVLQAAPLPVAAARDARQAGLSIAQAVLGAGER